MNGRWRESARCFATVLFPQPAGPVTSQMWCSFAGVLLVDEDPLVRTPLESPGPLSRAAFGEAPDVGVR